MSRLPSPAGGRRCRHEVTTDEGPHPTPLRGATLSRKRERAAKGFRMPRYSEDDIIARIFAPIAGAAALGLKDDAALLAPQSAPLVLTTDMVVAGVHFFADDAPALIAKKALRVNLSDLAAKGAEPIGFLLALALPADWTNDWLEAFAAGLAEDARAYGAPLIGGDTGATPGPLTISITALGRARRFVPRSGARPGDAIFVSGPIGDAALGLAVRRDPALARRLSDEARDYLIGRYLLPAAAPRSFGLARRQRQRRHGHFRRARRRSRQALSRLGGERDRRSSVRSAVRRRERGDRHRSRPVRNGDNGRRRL